MQERSGRSVGSCRTNANDEHPGGTAESRERWAQDLKQAATPLARRFAMLRRFHLSKDRECLVFDVSPSLSDSLDPEFCYGWLCFEQPDERRRLAPIPKNWLELTEQDLARLWVRATPVAKVPLHDRVRVDESSGSGPVRDASA